MACHAIVNHTTQSSHQDGNEQPQPASPTCCVRISLVWIKYIPHFNRMHQTEKSQTFIIILCKINLFICISHGDQSKWLIGIGKEGQIYEVGCISMIVPFPKAPSCQEVLWFAGIPQLPLILVMPYWKLHHRSYLSCGNATLDEAWMSLALHHNAKRKQNYPLSQ